MNARTHGRTAESPVAPTDADETWEIEDAAGVAARCSVWFRGPHLAGERVGCIGNYTARDADAAARLLARAFQRLRENGRTYALGPIDGSTWRRYRFATWSSGEPAFPFEPSNPAAYVDHFLDAGFAPVARYASWFDDAVDHSDARARVAARRLRAAGVVVRPFAFDEPERDLRAIYDLSRVAFARNYGQSPIGFDAFAATYRPALERVDPAYVLVAERAGRACGFVFALPDATFAQAGPVLVGKTLARDPDRAFAGLGAHLVARVRRTAARAGFAGYVSALVHENNASVAFPHAFGARVFRRYALYGKRLA